MSDITKIKVDGEPERSYQLYPRNEEFAKRSEGVQPDWNQNDETQLNYVKNRPFYEGSKEITIAFNPDDTYEVYVGMLHRISDIPIGFDEILSSKTSLVITSSGKTVDGIVTEENVFPGEGYYTAVVQSSYAGNGAQFMSIYEAQTEENFGAYVPIGLYVSYKSTSRVYVSQITYTASEVHTLDKKFIPDMDSVILNSSTADSTKKFKITVDDSGTLTAIEVT